MSNKESTSSTTTNTYDNMLADYKDQYSKSKKKTEFKDVKGRLKPKDKK